ncbi:MAG: 3D domain-containing protein [Candidatus Firestonebacteria bacterium]|nr:3D domain-containing protein [Candidatus Firestonebacteria bacterium]
MKKFLFLAGIFVITFLTGSVYFNPFKGNTKIIVDGNMLEADVKNATVYEVLKEKRISLDAQDIVIPSLNTLVTDGMIIRIQRVKEVNITVTEIIDAKTIIIKDKNLSAGEAIDLQFGMSGFIEKEAKVRYHDNKEIWRKIYNISRQKKPVDKIVVQGVSQAKRMYMLPKRLSATKTYSLLATGYYPGPEDCGPYADGLTANGMKAGYGVCAVDPRVIPLGTKLYVENYGYCIAADIGGGIKGNKIDLCFDLYKDSSVYQPKYVKVYILK